MRKDKERLIVNLIIVNKELEYFYLHMKDIFRPWDWELSDKLQSQIAELTKNYTAMFGVPPMVKECRTFEETCELKERLHRELKTS